MENQCHLPPQVTQQCPPLPPIPTTRGHTHTHTQYPRLLNPPSCFQCCVLPKGPLGKTLKMTITLVIYLTHNPFLCVSALPMYHDLVLILTVSPRLPTVLFMKLIILGKQPSHLSNICFLDYQTWINPRHLPLAWTSPMSSHSSYICGFPQRTDCFINLWSIIKINLNCFLKNQLRFQNQECTGLEITPCLLLFINLTIWLNVRPPT